MMNIFSRKNKLEDELFNMKFTAKTLIRNAKKCEKNQAAQKLKLKKAIEQGNMEGAKIYAQNVIREKNQALSYLQLASRMDAVAARVQTAISMGQLKTNMSGVVKGMDTVMESMNVEKISQTMDQFEKHFEDMDVRSAYMEGAMSSGTSLSTPADQVDDLIQMVADENGLKVAGQLDSAGNVSTGSACTSTTGQRPNMVHFSLRLRDNAYTEWRGEYVDYEGLKRLLDRQRQVDLALDAAATASATLDVGHDDDMEASVLSEKKWHPMTMNSGGSMMAKSIGNRLAFLRLSTASPTSTESEQLQSLLSTPVAFEETLDHEYLKVEHAYKRHAAQLGEQLEHLQVQYREDAPPSAQESLKNSLVELHRLLNLLHNFALLNYTGFVKILKRYEKIASFPVDQREGQKAKLQTFEFAKAQCCSELIKKVETSFADWYCDGNSTVAVATLMTKKEDFVNWGHIYLGIKAGSCLILLIWVCWDSLVVPTFHNGRENHLIDLVRTRAYPVYRGIGCLLLLHWLVGVSLYVWRAARINYRYIFELDPRRVQSYPQVFSDATNMTIVYLANVLMYYKVVNGYFPEELLHRGYYPLALFLYTFYFYAIRPWGQQLGMLRTLWEVVWSPLYAVSFFHTFVGDYLTSTVKVTQDITWSVCFFATKEFLRKDILPPGNSAYDMQSLTTPIETDEATCADNVYYVNVVVPLVCALPLWWRFLQNLRRVYDTKTWWPHLPNAAKYALTQVVVLFGLFHPLHNENGEEDALKLRMFLVVWLFLFTASSLYTWVWDVTMDWGLGRPQYRFLGDSQMFSRKGVYYAAIVADFFLRFAWTLTLIPPRGAAHWLPLYLQPFTMVLELFRRTFWSFFRLENEHLRNTQGFRRVDFIPLHYDHGVGNAEDKAGEEVEQLDFRVFTLKILAVLFTVLGLSVIAIVIER
ncbi:hypothetical protein BBJ29_004661 [Phytophthora kernoviae]|uniref:EXS domain-containing protein n=1 Tax=Phytophthora kernoviae TaxID=325452 RepID=A0A3F2RSM0_9STRA|nr:hypothetical protein BBP00_00004105 [Phytophthora kernoviae]RLN71207.1 hypothetical protein BBJ29_004661 [Phytophthora kernoviae]